MPHFSLRLDQNVVPCPRQRRTNVGQSTPSSHLDSVNSKDQEVPLAFPLLITTISLGRLGPSQQDLLFIWWKSCWILLFVEVFHGFSGCSPALGSVGSVWLRKEGVVQFPPTETALVILLRRCGLGPWGLAVECPAGYSTK